MAFAFVFAFVLFINCIEAALRGCPIKRHAMSVAFDRKSRMSTGSQGAADRANDKKCHLHSTRSVVL